MKWPEVRLESGLHPSSSGNSPEDTINRTGQGRATRGILKRKKLWIPKIKIWEGTVAHGSVDTREGQNIANSLRLLFGIENVMARGEWSFEDLHNDKLAFVTHTRNLASVFPFTTGQRTAEGFVKTMFYHGLPENVRDIVDAHGHSTGGSMVDEPINVIHCACWTTFLEYGKANANFPD